MDEKSNIATAHAKRPRVHERSERRIDSTLALSRELSLEMSMVGPMYGVGEGWVGRLRFSEDLSLACR